MYDYKARYNKLIRLLAVSSYPIKVLAVSNCSVKLLAHVNLHHTKNNSHHYTYTP